MNRKWPKKVHKGYWFYPVTDFVYDKEYAQKYEEYEETSMGKALLTVRLDTLKEYKKILDIGVGSGQLIHAKRYAKGYDVNPYMVRKLIKEKKWWNPYTRTLKDFDAICFFDSFEHIIKPELILNRVTTQDVVMAIPIFRGYESLKKSKHFRRDEHFHYFTSYGLITYMRNLGFEYKSVHAREIWLGREGIYTFVFKRIEK